MMPASTFTQERVALNCRDLPLTLVFSFRSYSGARMAGVCTSGTIKVFTQEWRESPSFNVSRQAQCTLPSKTEQCCNHLREPRFRSHRDFCLSVTKAGF